MFEKFKQYLEEQTDKTDMIAVQEDVESLYSDPKPMTVQMSQYVDFLKSQDAQNIFLDILIVEYEGKRQRIGMQINEGKNTCYIFDDTQYESLDDMISATFLSKQDEQLILAAFEDIDAYRNPDRWYKCSMDVRIEPELEKLEHPNN